jgi:hypothetical protein
MPNNRGPKKRVPILNYEPASQARGISESVQPPGGCYPVKAALLEAIRLVMKLSMAS